MARSWTDHSRIEWRTTGDQDNTPPSDDRIKIGCLQRIADATELMARRYQDLIDERDRYGRWYEDEQAKNARLARSNAALRGIVNKMKKGRKA